MKRFRSILIAMPLCMMIPQAHAFDARTLPIIGALINLFSPQQQNSNIKAPSVVVQNRGPIQSWPVPQPTVGYAYTQPSPTSLYGQPVYNIYQPNPQNYRPVAQNINGYPQPTMGMQQGQGGYAQNNQGGMPGNVLPPPNALGNAPQWQYNVTPSTYEQTSPIPYLPESIANNPSASVENISIDANNTAKRVVDTTDSGKYRWPVGTNSSGTQNAVTSIYGPRDRDLFVPGCSDGTAPASHCGVQKHNGIDIKAPVGTPIESMTSGTIAYVAPYCSNPATKNAVNKDPTNTVPRGGCSISVMNDNGELVTYQHLSDTNGVKVGDSVKAGDNIGKTGNSGASFGAHLDLSMCEISPEKLKAAQDAKKDISRCESIGGKNVNPLDKLDDSDPRAQSARDREKANNDYIACKKTAGSNSAELKKCRNAYAAAKAKIGTGTAAPAKNIDIKNAPITGKLNMERI